MNRGKVGKYYILLMASLIAFSVFWGNGRGSIVIRVAVAIAVLLPLLIIFVLAFVRYLYVKNGRIPIDDLANPSQEMLRVTRLDTLERNPEFVGHSNKTEIIFKVPLRKRAALLAIAVVFSGLAAFGFLSVYVSIDTHHYGGLLSFPVIWSIPLSIVIFFMFKFCLLPYNLTLNNSGILERRGGRRTDIAWKDITKVSIVQNRQVVVAYNVRDGGQRNYAISRIYDSSAQDMASLISDWNHKSA